MQDSALQTKHKQKQLNKLQQTEKMMNKQNAPQCN